MMDYVNYALSAMGYTAVGYACWQLVKHIIIFILAIFGIGVMFPGDEGYDDEDGDY